MRFFKSAHLSHALGHPAIDKRHAPQAKEARLRGAFSSFELLCVVVIVGIMASVGVRYLGQISHKQCILGLKSRLAHTQSALSSYYADSFLSGSEPSSTRAREILNRLTFENLTQTSPLPHTRPICGFVLSSKGLEAHIKGQILSFIIDPPSMQHNPRIYCNLAQPLCKEFSDRKLDK